MKVDTKQQRAAGILMPITSLPSNCGIGTLGEGAYAFIDWLASAGMRIWQVLPLLPTSYGDSPYQSYASNALNYYLIDFALLEEDGLLTKDEYASIDWAEDELRVDYGRQYQHKAAVLRKAFARFDKTSADWQSFLETGFYYDFALFKTLKKHFSDRAWTDWPTEYRCANEKALAEFEREYADEIAFWQFTQFLFLKQWSRLKDYAHEKGISIFGDMPIYVAYDSVETWKYREELFLLDGQGNLALKAGVPPDAFCEDGQLWGNPVYDWEKMKGNGYAWWKARIEDALQLFDVVRIDHFRGFDRFYAVAADAVSAKEGEWLDGPSYDLFRGLEGKSIVAEDLGMIDEGVRALMKKTGYPGMKVLMFAFDGNKENEYLPSLYETNCVAYTGTHDNEPLRTYIEALPTEQRKDFERAVERECLLTDVAYITETIEDECQSIVELLFASKADRVIVPMHDVLCRGEEARINAPSTLSNGNWTIRYTQKDFRRRKAAWLKSLTELYHR